MAKTQQKKQQVRRRLLERRARRNGRDRHRHKANPDPQSLPLVLCRISAKWREIGAATLVVARRRPNGLLMTVLFYVDLYGVGLKDCFHRRDATLAEVQAHVLEQRELGPFEECSEDFARQVVWGGYYYGRKNGFHPPREFRNCRNFLAPLPEEEVDWGLFGKDGKPLIIGDYLDLKRRSRGKFSLENPGFHFIAGFDAAEFAGHDPWEVLLEQDDLDLPPDKERLLFIEGAYFGPDFDTLYQQLLTWDDLQLLEDDEDYALFGWSRPYPKNHWNPLSILPGSRQALGEVRIEGDMLSVSVNGKSWMLIMNARLAEAFGPSLTRGPLKVQDPLKMRSVRGAEA